MSKLKQVAIAVDRLANTILGGYADETISARCWRLRAEPPYKALRVVIDVIFFFQKEHCKQAYESELNRLQSPSSQRPPL